MPREPQRVQAHRCGVERGKACVAGTLFKKARKQPHAKYKSLKNFVGHGARFYLQGRLTRRAKQAQDCMIANCEFAVEPDAINRSAGRSGSRCATSSSRSQNCMLDIRICLPSGQARHGHELQWRS
jgi:hypothetical protein